MNHSYIRFSALLAAALGASACSGALASFSSGQIGCPSNEIVISDDQGGWGVREWTAQCRDRTYYCSAHGGGSHSSAQVSCRENSDSAATAAPGCTADVQCKGDRICRAGQCVDPVAAR